MIKSLEFFAGKRVFITGSTGFKGSWLCLALSLAGAEVSGYALEPATQPNLFTILGLNEKINQTIGNICDLRHLSHSMAEANPEIVIHMAAQPILRKGYENPVETFATNTLGTVHALEAARSCEELKSLVIITTDKVYKNENWHWAYRETDGLGGHDPYSTSKACSEMAVECYRSSFLPTEKYGNGHQILIATARAGNVIGGGDWSPYRIVPDIVRGVLGKGEELVLRNVHATRPWEHVLEPLSGYLMLAKGLYEGNTSLASAWNFAPHTESCVSVEHLVQEALRHLNSTNGYRVQPEPQKEDQRLELDASKAKRILGWRPHLTLDETLAWTFQWYSHYYSSGDIAQFTQEQIVDYFERQGAPARLASENLLEAATSV